MVNVEEGRPPILRQRRILESVENGTSPRIRDIVPGLAPSTLAAARAGNVLDVLVEIPNEMRPDAEAKKSPYDNAGSAVAGKGSIKWRGPEKLLNVFDDGVNDDNWEVLGTLIAPPDTVGGVGKNYYVQMFNLLKETFDKDGNSVLGPLPTRIFLAGMSGNCAISDDGDPIVLYDEETGRWMVSRFLASFQDGLCIAISETGDPTGRCSTITCPASSPTSASPATLSSLVKSRRTGIARKIRG